MSSASRFFYKLYCVYYLKDSKNKNRLLSMAAIKRLFVRHQSYTGDNTTAECAFHITRMIHIVHLYSSIIRRSKLYRYENWRNTIVCKTRTIYMLFIREVLLYYYRRVLLYIFTTRPRTKTLSYRPWCVMIVTH